MSGIVLSASVRQNLLSLQSTASLLAKTQNDLATGNKVNSALDNPTNFFTAQSLNNRASDIGNLLDGIGNGVQVLQAANTGLTSLQGLVASAQSIANQVLQTPTGYSTKSNVTSAALTGATASNLLALRATASTGSVVNNDNTGTAVAITTATVLSGTAHHLVQRPRHRDRHQRHAGRQRHHLRLRCRHLELGHQHRHRRHRGSPALDDQRGGRRHGVDLRRRDHASPAAPPASRCPARRWPSSASRLSVTVSPARR